MGIILNRVSTIAGSKRMQISDLARAAGVSYDTAARYWNAESAGIRFSTLAAFCDVLECTPNDLFPYMQDDSNEMHTG